MRVTKFLCKAKSNTPAEPEISTSVKSNDSQERFRNFSGETSREGLSDVVFEERKYKD